MPKSNEQGDLFSIANQDLLGDFSSEPSVGAETKREAPKFTPTEFLAVVNQALEYDFASTVVVGEVASYKENQGKWVFFDLKDEESSVSCFMPLWQLRIPIEDGMKIEVRAVPKVTKWGKFSLTISTLKPVGAGSLKKAFELLRLKLEKEGLFDVAKKRPIPSDLTRLGVISSTGAAGYADFVKILNARWGGIHVQVAHTQVQGLDAPDQIIRALNYFNERGEVQAIAILRGGGSADDLSAFNDEALVRAVAASKIPVVSGIGHEVDVSLVDLAADLRASTPSNAAELITHDRHAVSMQLKSELSRTALNLTERLEHEREANQQKIERLGQSLIAKYIEPMLLANNEKLRQSLHQIMNQMQLTEDKLEQKIQLLEALNPDKILKQGYAILTGKITVDSVVKITTAKQLIKAKVKEVHDRN